MSIIFDGKEINNKGYLLYTQSVPIDINGKIAYMVVFEEPVTTRMPEWTKQTIYYNGAVIDKMYDQIVEIFPFKGKLAYVARNNNKSFVVIDGVIVSKEYNNISNAKELDGKVAFLASDNIGAPLKNYAVYDGKEYGKEYYDVSSFHSVQGKFGYEATVKNSETSYGHVSIYDGQQISREKYTNIILPARNLTKKSYGYGDVTADIYYKDKIVGSGYNNRTISVTHQGGKSVFYAEKNGKGFIISE